MLELSPIGSLIKQERKIMNEVVNNPLEDTKNLDRKADLNNSEEIYKVLLELKHQKNRSWVQLRNGCLDLQGLPVSLTTQPVKNTSRAFARECHRNTGLSF